MKNTTYLFGLLAIIFISTGTYSKLMHWPGAWMELVIGIAILTLIFTPLALINHYKNEKQPSVLLYLATLLTTILLFGSALIKITHWQGESTIGQISLLLAVVVYLPL